MKGRTPIVSKIQKKLEARVILWKNKAIARGKRLHSTEKQLKESKARSQKWKQKYYAEKLRHQQEEKQRQEEKNHSVACPIKVKNHSYDLSTIDLCIQLKEAGLISLRSCRKILMVLNVVLGLNLKIPSIDSIRNWEHKKGYYNLSKTGNIEDEYAFIIDESFCIGGQTLLLILGVRLGDYTFKKSLSFEDVTLLTLQVKPSWPSEQIQEELNKLLARGYRGVYATTDGGNNIVKSLKNSHIVRVEDCTHVFSKIIEKAYKNAEEFISFTARCSLLNRQNYMGKDAVICPPCLKGKSRYLNLYALSKWGVKNLKLLRHLATFSSGEEQRIYDKLSWLENYSELIGTLGYLVELIESIFAIIKHKGLSEEKIKEVKKLVEQPQVPTFFKQGVNKFIEDNVALLAKYEKLICCSDIIESHFGKFKNQQRQNPEKGITINCLKIANYGRTMEKEELRQAMEKVKMVDLQKWKDENHLKTFNARKKDFYKSVG